MAAVYRPDHTFSFADGAQVIESTKQDVKNVNDAIKYALLTKGKHLRFIPLEKEYILVAVFIKASVAS